MSRRHDFEVNPDSWPSFDVGALPPARQMPFKARRLAVELYSSGVTLCEIESRTGVADEWYAYREKHLLEFVSDWLKAAGIEYKE